MKKAVGWAGFLTGSGFYIREGGVVANAKDHAKATAWNVFMGTTPKQDGETWTGFAERVAERFAGYMRTGIEERAVAACRQRAKWPTTFIERGLDFEKARAASEAVIAVGREILAAETPKERFTVGEVPGGSYRPFYVSDREATSGNGTKGARIAKFTNRDDAYNYANAKNREDK